MAFMASLQILSITFWEQKQQAKPIQDSLGDLGFSMTSKITQTRTPWSLEAPPAQQQQPGTVAVKCSISLCLSDTPTQQTMIVVASCSVTKLDPRLRLAAETPPMNPLPKSHGHPAGGQEHSPGRDHGQGGWGAGLAAGPAAEVLQVLQPAPDGLQRAVRGLTPLEVLQQLSWRGRVGGSMCLMDMGSRQPLGGG